MYRQLPVPLCCMITRLPCTSMIHDVHMTFLLIICQIYRLYHLFTTHCLKSSSNRRRTCGADRSRAPASLSTLVVFIQPAAASQRTFHSLLFPHLRSAPLLLARLPPPHPGCCMRTRCWSVTDYYITPLELRPPHSPLHPSVHVTDSDT